MSSFNLAKRLLPAKKAWKSFTKTLQSEVLQKLNIPKAVKKIPPLIPSKLRSRSDHYHHHHRHRHLHHSHQYYGHHHQLQKNFASIYEGPVSLDAQQIHPPKETIKAKEMGSTRSSAWKATFPQLQGIDERAEAFISRFRDDMKLQREGTIHH